MKRTLYAALKYTGLAIGISACAEINQKARLAPADYLDAGTTAIGLTANFAEANPILSPCGAGAPVCALALKYGVKSAAIHAGGQPDEVNRTVETLSMFAGCMNLATFAGATVPPAALAGIGCAAYFNKHSKMRTTTMIEDNPT